MTLVPCKIEETKRSWTNLYAVLTNFLEGNEDCVKVENYTHKSAISCRECLDRAIKRFYKGQIKVIKRGDTIYLVKTIALKK